MIVNWQQGVRVPFGFRGKPSEWESLRCDAGEIGRQNPALLAGQGAVARAWRVVKPGAKVACARQVARALLPVT